MKYLRGRSLTGSPAHGPDLISRHDRRVFGAPINSYLCANIQGAGGFPNTTSETPRFPPARVSWTYTSTVERT